LVAVTLVPDCDQLALQPGVVTRWLPANAKRSDQLEIGSPTLVIFTLAVKPPPQSVTV
jgi:hypothetical protein